MRVTLFAVISLFVAVHFCGLAFAGDAQDAATAPNDSLFEAQRPYFEKMNVLKAWEITKGAPTVVIGVVDTGFDFFHPDLESQLRSGFYADEVYHTEIHGMISHGTLVAGLMVAEADNKIGVAGLAPDCTVLTASVGAIEHTLIKLKSEFDAAHPEATMEE